MQTPNQDDTTQITARDVVTNPEEYLDNPALIAFAWEQLLKARGKTMRLENIGEPAHNFKTTPQPELSLASDLALRSPRVAQQVRERKSKLDAQQSPFDGDAA